ncbi:TspO/MBR family protein [Azospirillum sp. sgz301742]
MAETAHSSNRAGVHGPVRWWHAVLFWVLVNAPGFVARHASVPFEGYVVVPLQPPPWVFPVVWFALNVLQLWGDVRLLNRRAEIRHWAALVVLQGVLWAIFATFTTVYFTLGSPVLAAVWTIAFFVLAALSIALVWRDDRAVALSWVPLILWTGFASVVAVQQALLNPDRVFGGV